MLNTDLASALDAFTKVTLNLPDAALDIVWGWRDYTGEGIRFAFFRTYEELTDLAITLKEKRCQTVKLTTAQRLLGYYHAAYMDLQAVCLGISDEIAERIPAEGEWPARNALSHIIGADLGFYGVIFFALEKHRAGTWLADEKIKDADWDRILGLSEAEYDELLNSPFNTLLDGHSGWHLRILRKFSPLTEQELTLPVRFWEKECFPIQFRLGRFASHMRQHTIQIEKILRSTLPAPNESRHLIRMLYNALARVNAATLGDDSVGQKACQALAQTIMARTTEITEALVSETSH
jgi:hypothetical protein